MTIDILRTGFKELGLSYNEKIETDFMVYKNLLLEWNKKINITRIEKEEDIYVKHYLDSIILLNSKIKKDAKIIDIGTGGGFPGFPLKIVNNNFNLTLLDSLRKRTNFLNLVADELGFNDIEILHGRAEDFGCNKIYREKYDLCVSRAVASLNILSEFCLPFVKENGYFVAYKSENITEEMELSNNAIIKLGGKIEEVKEIIIPNSSIIRKLVFIKKVKKTPYTYPRKAGTPAKKPLL